MHRRTKTSSLAALAALAAFPPAAGAAITATDTQIHTADVAATLEAAFPGALAWGELAVGAAGSESASQLVNVKSNKSWGVQIRSDAATGRMRLWNSTLSMYGTALTNALQWRLATLGGAAQGTSYSSLSSTAANIATTQGVTSDSGVDLGVRFRQVMSYADSPAPTGQTYRIIVTYDAQQGF